MMSDIFISYSRKDSDEAGRLAEQLRSLGISVWLDTSSLSGAEVWSAKIVEAIRSCSVFIVLLSPESVASVNVTKEVSLASESDKTIIPIKLSACTLNSAMEYALAGLHRVSITDEDTLTRTFEKLELIIRNKSGLTVSYTEILAEQLFDNKLHLAILPFDDLSPAKDNEWFADGMMHELIDMLSSVERLHVNPHTDVIFYKNRKPRLEELAADLNCHFVVEGSVQKAGEKIRIRASLSDARKRRQLWSEKYDGIFDDIFDLQDKTCSAITEALKLTLTPEETKKIEKKPTTSTEAYELFLRGQHYFERHTHSDYEISLQLLEQAIELDSSCSEAWSNIASISLAIYRSYDRDERWLSKAESALEQIRKTEGESNEYFWIRSRLKYSRDDLTGALADVQQSVAINPNFNPAYNALAITLTALGDFQKAAETWELLRERRPNDLNYHFSLLHSLHAVGDTSHVREAASTSLIAYERHLRLNPDDYFTEVKYGFALLYAGRSTEALEQAEGLSNLPHLDGRIDYNLACLYIQCGELDKAIRELRKAIGNGFLNIDTILRDSDLDPLRDKQEFKNIVSELRSDLSGPAND